MSRDAVAGFLERVAENPHLQQKLAKAFADRKDSATREMVELARELGFHFTAAELDQALSENQSPARLSEKELEAVAGGGVAPMIRKLTSSEDSSADTTPRPST